MSPRLRVLALAGLALVSACASQPEDAGVASEPMAERRAEQAPEAEPAAVEAAPRDDGERSLVDIERELASNEARLRELGVLLPSGTATVAGGDAGAAESEDRPDAKSSSKSSGGGVSSGKSSAAPSTAPAPAGDNESTSDRTNRKDRPERNKEKKGKAEQAKPSKRDADGFAPPPPEPDAAKAAPPSSSNRAEIEAAARCQQVCELGQITCELSVQICELAERHDDEDDYRAACERSADDCSAAQEACNVCEA